MLSRDLAIHDLDARQWVNLRRLLEPEYGAYLAGGDATLPLVLLLDDGKPVKAVRVGKGRVPLDRVRWHGPLEIDRARKENGGSFLLALEIATADAILRDIEGRLRVDEDMVAQALHVARAVRAHMGRGLWLSPRLLADVPVPSYEAVQRTFDILFPDERSVVISIFEGTTPHASLIVTKRGGDIVEITTLARLGTTIRDWRADYRRILADAERRCAKPHIGFFAERAAWDRVVSGTSSVSLELAQRTIILDPAPAWLMGLVAADVGMQVARVGLGLLQRFVPPQVVGVAKGMALSAAEKGPFALLGFDPFAVAAQLLRLRRPPPT